MPKDISFHDKHGNEEKYFILRDNKKGAADNFFPILKQSVTGIDKFIFKTDKMVKQKYDNHQNRLCSINNILEDFSYGSSINHYRRHREHEITPVSEQEEDEMSDHYTEIPSYQEGRGDVPSIPSYRNNILTQIRNLSCSMRTSRRI